MVKHSKSNTISHTGAISAQVREGQSNFFKKFFEVRSHQQHFKWYWLRVYNTYFVLWYFKSCNLL